MNKHIISIVAVFLLLTVSLSGCSEQKIDIYGDTEKVELVSYKIETLSPNQEKLGDGFVRSEEAWLYKITGIVKNIANQELANIWVFARFYDRDYNFLDSRRFSMADVLNNTERNFSMTVTSSYDYFSKIWIVDFVLMAIKD